MGSGLQTVWIMGYEGFMGSFSTSPTYQVCYTTNLWDYRDHGFLGVWVKRALTVAPLVNSGENSRHLKKKKKKLAVGTIPHRPGSHSRRPHVVVLQEFPRPVAVS